MQYARFRISLAGLGVAALAACTPAVPDSASNVPDPGRGVGFNNSVTEIRAAQAPQPQQQIVEVSSVPSPAGAAGPTSRPAPSQTARTTTSNDPEIARLNAEADARARAANSGQAVVQASPGNAPPVIVNNPGISSEQDFDTVSSRRSIEGDAARIASNRQQYQVIAPTELPTREAGSQPNVVQFALSQKHPKGTQVWRRSGLTSAAKTQRNCAAYASADEAQIDFLAQGGPQRDRKGLDPDGDGYACGWDPAPFRRAAG